MTAQRRPDDSPALAIQDLPGTKNGRDGLSIVGPAGIVRREGQETKRKQRLTLIEREGDGHVSLCPELDIASQGDTIEGARVNLIEAVELFFESASPSEVREKLWTRW